MAVKLFKFRLKRRHSGGTTDDGRVMLSLLRCVWTVVSVDGHDHIFRPFTVQVGIWPHCDHALTHTHTDNSMQHVKLLPTQLYAARETIAHTTLCSTWNYCSV